MGIQHDPELAAQYTKNFNGSLGNIQNSPTAQWASYSNLYGVTKAVVANNQYLELGSRYQTYFTAFSNQINAVAQNFAALDQQEAAKIGGN